MDSGSRNVRYNEPYANNFITQQITHPCYFFLGKLGGVCSSEGNDIELIIRLKAIRTISTA